MIIDSTFKRIKTVVRSLKKKYPSAYRVKSLEKSELGICRDLLEASLLAQEKGYLNPNLVKFYAIYDNGVEELVSKEYYSYYKFDNVKYLNLCRWNTNNAIAIAEQNIFKFQDLKERTCWSCNNPLAFRDFFSINSSLGQAHAIELWENPHIELYCCFCFQKIKDQFEQEKKQEELEKCRVVLLEELDPEERKILEKLEREIGKKIPLVSEMTDHSRIKNQGFISKQGHIVGISLYYYGLDQFPDSLKEFDSLEYLDLSGNFISCIPSWINRFQKLKFFKLLSNNLLLVPESISELGSLEFFDLSGNKLVKVPESIKYLPSLKFLYLWANNIAPEPTFFEDLRRKGVNIVM